MFLPLYLAVGLVRRGEELQRVLEGARLEEELREVVHTHGPQQEGVLVGRAWKQREIMSGVPSELQNSPFSGGWCLVSKQ